jgi:hypothetical protein
MSDTFSGKIRWFACFAMILIGIVATAATGCTKKAYAGDCSLGLNGGCQVQQQFVQQQYAPQRFIVQQQVQPYYQQQLVQQVVVPHRQQLRQNVVIVQQQRQHHVQQIQVQQQRQPRRSVQSQRIVTRNR